MRTKNKQVTEADLNKFKREAKAFIEKRKAIERRQGIAREVAEELAFNRRQHPLFKKNRNRNRPCICGSGKKFKKCCLKKIPENIAWIPTKMKTWRI